MKASDDCGEEGRDVTSTHGQANGPVSASEEERHLEVETTHATVRVWTSKSADRSAAHLRGDATHAAKPIAPAPMSRLVPEAVAASARRK